MDNNNAADDLRELNCKYCQMPLKDEAQFHPIEYCWAFLHNDGRGTPEEIAHRINIGMEYLADTHPRIELLKAELAEVSAKAEKYENALLKSRYAINEWSGVGGNKASTDTLIRISRYVKSALADRAIAAEALKERT